MVVDVCLPGDDARLQRSSRDRIQHDGLRRIGAQQCGARRAVRVDIERRRACGLISQRAASLVAPTRVSREDAVACVVRALGSARRRLATRDARFCSAASHLFDGVDHKLAARSVTVAEPSFLGHHDHLSHTPCFPNHRAESFMGVEFDVTRSRCWRTDVNENARAVFGVACPRIQPGAKLGEAHVRAIQLDCESALHMRGTAADQVSSARRSSAQAQRARARRAVSAHMWRRWLSAECSARALRTPPPSGAPRAASGCHCSAARPFQRCTQRCQWRRTGRTPRPARGGEGARRRRRRHSRYRSSASTRCTAPAHRPAGSPAAAAPARQSQPSRGPAARWGPPAGRRPPFRRASKTVSLHRPPSVPCAATNPGSSRTPRTRGNPWKVP